MKYVNFPIYSNQNRFRAACYLCTLICVTLWLLSVLSHQITSAFARANTGVDGQVHGEEKPLCLFVCWNFKFVAKYIPVLILA